MKKPSLSLKFLQQKKLGDVSLNRLINIFSPQEQALIPRLASF